MTSTSSSTTRHPQPPYDELAAKLRGPLIGPSSPDFDQARAVWSDHQLGQGLLGGAAPDFGRRRIRQLPDGRRGAGQGPGRLPRQL